MDAFALARIFLALVFVVVLILACGWIARRNLASVKGAVRTNMAVTSRIAVGPRGMQVMVVEVENERLVLGVTPGSINLLHTLSPRESGSQPVETAPGTPSFASVFNNMMGRKA